MWICAGVVSVVGEANLSNCQMGKMMSMDYRIVWSHLGWSLYVLLVACVITIQKISNRQQNLAKTTSLTLERPEQQSNVCCVWRKCDAIPLDAATAGIWWFSTRTDVELSTQIDEMTSAAYKEENSRRIILYQDFFLLLCCDVSSNPTSRICPINDDSWLMDFGFDACGHM